VNVPNVSVVLEGASRPHFFGGVATVVTKLLVLCLPDRLYMGQKDGQQCVVVKNLVRDLLFPTKLVVGPTVRESDGLAMSSRNVYLTGEERRSAAAISQALKQGCAVYAGGICDRKAIISAVTQVVNSADHLTLEYVGLVNEAMEEVEKVNGSGAMVCVAVRTSVTNTRLIDNEFIGKFLA
jgi:pantoate--beta-alanine ligase